MAKAKPRTCTQCGKVDITASRSKICAVCYHENKKAANIKSEIAQLLEFGYENPVLQPISPHGHRLYSLLHPCCGTETVRVFMNVVKRQQKRPDKLSCTHCGGKERMAVAMRAYVEKYKWEPGDLAKWKDYLAVVRRYTIATYDTHKAIINPNNLKRSYTDYHLDHIKPIIQCFLDGDTPGVCCSC